MISSLKRTRRESLNASPLGTGVFPVRKETLRMADRVGQQLGHYRLLRVLGQGAFAQVYQAEHLYLERPAAIKALCVQMEPEAQEQFRREARTIAHLQHPHIVQVLDFGIDDQTPYLVMEYTPGGTLRSHHPKGTRLPLEQIVTYVKQIALALDYAHQQSIIHRDVKPENLLLNAKHEILLSDFGIAVVQRTLDSLSTQHLAGTPLYMAPEQIQRQACAASDQYALGIVVYEWLTGQTPFHGMLYEVISHHLYQPPPSLRVALPDLPVAVEEAVFKALAKDPVQRFACVTDFASALEEASLATQPYSLHGPGCDVMTPYKVSEAEIAPDDLTVAPSPSGASLQAPPPTHYGSPLYGVPQQNPYEPLNSYAVPLQAPPSPPPRRLSVGLTALMVGVIFLLLAGSGGLYYATVFRPNQLNAQASSTAEMQRTATMHAQQGTATSQAQQATATALANTPQAIYNRATSGSPVLDDPLSHNDDNNWDESHTATYSCTFSGGAYHASLNLANSVVICPAYAATFRNVAYQVQMTLIKGDRGGILFRFTSDKFSGYSFSLASDGTYALSLLQGSSKLNVRSGSSSFIKTGLKQNNLLTVVASGSNIYLYVNKQFVTSVSDTTFSSGQIGVQASEDSLPSEVVFRNAQVWNV